MLTVDAQIAGRHATSLLPGDIFSLLHEQKAWDGLDAVFDNVEEIDLSELEEM
jgi:hypothetical protein